MSQKPRTSASAKAASVSKVAVRSATDKPAAEMAVTDVSAEPAVPAEIETPSIAVVEEILEAAPAQAEPEIAVEPAPAQPEPVMAQVETLPEMPVDADPVPPAAAEAVPPAETKTPTLTTQTVTLIPGIKTMMKSTEDFVAFGQANMEAFVKSSQIWAAGVQDLTKQFATTAKASFDESVSTFKAMTSVKSVKEAFELQSSFAKASMEKAIAESNKLTDASIKLTEQALAPITARVTSAVETFSKAA